MSKRSKVFAADLKESVGRRQDRQVKRDEKDKRDALRNPLKLGDTVTYEQVRQMGVYPRTIPEAEAWLLALQNERERLKANLPKSGKGRDNGIFAISKLTQRIRQVRAEREMMADRARKLLRSQGVDVPQWSHERYRAA